MSTNFVVIWTYHRVFLSCLTRRLIAYRHSILVYIDYDDIILAQYVLSTRCVIASRLNDLPVRPQLLTSPGLGENITIDNPVSELTCLPMYPKELSLLLITSTHNNRKNCTICTRMYFFRFLLLLPGANYPTSSYCRVHMSHKFVLMSQTNKQAIMVL